MPALNFRQLIDLAIGTPEPGHVNFHALHCLLYSFADELNIIDKPVDCRKYTNINVTMIQSAEQEGGVEATPASNTEAAAEAAKKSEHQAEHKGNVTETIDQLEKRLSEVEMETGVTSMELNRGLSMMREQLYMTMDQLQALTKLTLSNDFAKVAPRKLEKLRLKAAKLNVAQVNNPYIPTLHIITAEDYTGGSLESSSHTSEENVAEHHEEDEQDSKAALEKVPDNVDNENFDMDLHLSYPPEKILEQLLELKSEFCMLTNKVNEISASLLEQDSHHVMQGLQELTIQMGESKIFAMTLKELMDIMESRQNSSLVHIDNIHKTLRELAEHKVDKAEINVMLANKVDYKQLQGKVSHEQMQELKCQLERQLCELQNLINQNEKNTEKLVGELRTTLGYDSIESILKKFKDKIEQDLSALQETLQKYIDSTNDECAAAGARMKVLQDLACISCDTTCVMRTIEKSKVGKLPDAHASSMLSPLITYELGSIRKSGLMGYYRKDEFPHAPNAWMNRQVPMTNCVARHAGGAHTTSTAKERVEKVLLNKK